MFFSVSNASSNTTVRTQFTASESCIVVIPAGPNQGVAVNGIPTLDTSIQLEIGDEITLDLISPNEGEIVFYEWSYNGNTCFFAITSRNNLRNRTTRSGVEDLAWWEFSNPQTDITYQGVNFDGILNYSIEVDSQSSLPLPEGREDIIAFLEPTNDRVVFFYNIDGETNGLLSIPNNFHTLDLPSKPRSIARLLNNSNLRYEHYILCENGFIYRVDHQFQITQSSISHPNTAWVLVSDDINLWVAGDQYLVRMADMNTISQVISSTEFITAGAACGPLVMFSAKGGKALRVSGSQIQVASSVGWKGIPVSTSNRIWFPEPTRNRVIGFNASTASIASFQTVGSVSSLPWGSGSNGEDLVISYLDERSVGFLPDNAAFAVPRNLAQETMFIGCSDNWIIGSSFLADLRFTNVNSPEIIGPAFGYREGPEPSEIGSGDFQVSSENEITPVSIAPNTQAVIDGQFITGSSTPTISSISDGAYIGLVLGSNLEKRSTAVVIGTQAFDYVVRGVNTSARTTVISPGIQSVSPASLFSFEVPNMVINSPISVGAGTIFINGQRHDGVSRVNGGDEIQVSLRLRTDQPNRSTILSIADSQFALLAHGRPEVELDVIEGAPSDSIEITSQITISETGSYHIPRYFRHVTITRNGVTLFPSPNFGPITLIQNDQVTINHVRSSHVLNDTRRTYIIGPNSNLYVESSSFVDDEPNAVDFGIIALLEGFPRIPAFAPNTVTITGLTPGFPIRISSDDPNITFSVNDGEFESSPLVVNGDTLRAQYLVRNLFDSKSVFSERSSGQLFLLGTIGIESPIESSFLGFNSMESQEFEWARFSYLDFSHQNVPIFDRNETSYSTNAPTGDLISFDQMETISPLPELIGFDSRFTIAPTSDSYGIDSRPESPGMLDDFLSYSSVSYLEEEILDRFQDDSSTQYLSFDKEPSHLSLIQLFSYNANPEWLDLHIGSEHQREWENQSHEIERLFQPVFEFTPEMAPRMFLPNWSWLNENLRYQFSPTWSYLSPDRPIQEFVVIFQALKDVFSIEFIDLEYQFDPLTQYIEKTVTPVFLGPQTYSTTSITSRFQESQSLKDNVIQGHFVSDPLWDTNLPLRTGGFIDQSEATIAGQFAAGDLTFETYQQPEGSWSFIVNRDTSLVCPVQPTSLRAVAWLLGGG